MVGRGSMPYGLVVDLDQPTPDSGAGGCRLPHGSLMTILPNPTPFASEVSFRGHV